MNSMLKEKLDFVIRVVKEHGYKIKILKNKEKPKEVEKIISISPPKCIDDKNMLTFHKYIKNSGFSCLVLGENHNTTEHYIKQFLGVETDCPVCYLPLNGSEVWCQKCKAIVCMKCSEQITRCPICQNEEWTIKHIKAKESLNSDELWTLFENEYQEEYEKFTGEDTRGSNNAIYTLNQEITRYSKILAFWCIKLKELDEHREFHTPDGITSYNNKRTFFMNIIKALHFKMDNMFTTEIIIKILKESSKLC